VACKGIQGEKAKGGAERVLVFGFAQHDTKGIGRAVRLRSPGPPKSRRAFKSRGAVHPAPLSFGERAGRFALAPWIHLDVQTLDET